MSIFFDNCINLVSLMPCDRHSGRVYPQVQSILTSMQAQPHLIDPYARHELNLDLRIYQAGTKEFHIIMKCAHAGARALQCSRGA